MTTNGKTRTAKRPAVRTIPATPHRLISFSTSTPMDSDERRDPIWIQVDDERFECCPVPPAGVLQDLRLSMAGVGEENPDILGAEMEFICSVMVTDADADRFRALLRRRESPVSAKLLDAIWTRLLEEYTGTPLVEPSDSTDGSTTISSSSAEASFAAAPLPSPDSPSVSGSP